MPRDPASEPVARPSRLRRLVARGLALAGRVTDPPVRQVQRHLAGGPQGVPVTATGALRTADALASLHLLVAARDLLAMLAPACQTGAVGLRRVELALALGDGEAAQALHHGVDLAALSRAEALRHALLGVDLVNLTRGAEAALDALGADIPAAPDDPRVTEHRLRLLFHADLTGARFLPLSKAQMTARGGAALRRRHVEFCLNRNLAPQARPLLDDWLRHEPRSVFALEKSLVLAWQMQDEAGLEHLVDRIIAARAHDPAILGFAMERVSALPAFARLRDAAIRTELGRRRALPVGALTWSWHLRQARIEGLLDAPGPGHDRLNRVLARYPFLPVVRLHRARLAAQLGRDTGADLDIVLRDAPQLPEAYALRFAALNARPGTEAEIAALLDRRRAHVPRFRQAAVAARHGTAALPALPATYDIEQFQLDLRQGQLASALARRAARPPNRLLEALLPGRYTGFAQPFGGPGARVRRLGVIGWEGVADEIRWAQTYGLLPDLADQVLISCEPRLLSLMQRSFPWAEVVAVPRRWTHHRGAAPVLRHDIPEPALSAAVDGALLSRLGGCDRVLFADEITFHLLTQDPARLSGHRARLTGGYLRPDPDRLARHRVWLRGMAGDLAEGAPCVGLLWRSQVQYGPRNAHYLDLDDLLPLARQGCARFVALQARMTGAERDACDRAGIVVPDGVDLHDDFEEVAALTAALDLVTGVSSLPYELAAAVGTPVWLAAVSAQGVYQRRGTCPDGADQLTLHGRLITPQGPLGDRRAASADVIGQIGARLRQGLPPRPPVRD